MDRGPAFPLQLRVSAVFTTIFGPVCLFENIFLNRLINIYKTVQVVRLLTPGNPPLYAISTCLIILFIVDKYAPTPSFMHTHQLILGLH